jgi:hypothetical protein
MSLTELLKNAENGYHSACKECPWNPKRVEKPAFGVSCIEHGIDWSGKASAVSVLVAQDPGGTTPEKTRRLCGICNTKNATDLSAQHGYFLWKAAVSLADSGLDARRYMKNHYWTNAVMHGVKNDTQLEKARGHCKDILFEQINLLSPRIIIATGKVACESLFDLDLITKPWEEINSLFSHQVYSERKTLTSGTEVTVYCTFHGSARGVKFLAANLYSDNTKKLLNEKIEQLPVALPAQRFLRQYQGVSDEDKGMRVLLLHWLEIGEGIRRENAD